MRQLFMILTVAAMVFVAAQAQAESTVHVVSPVPYGDASSATDAVKAECDLDTRLPEFIQDYAKGGLKVVIGGDTSKGRVLKLEFTNVLGTGGGAWSGSKSVTANGELWENGEKIGSFISTRYSGGGAFGGFKGTCSILGRCIKAMGKDISTWLNNPTMNARLGDA